MLDLHCHILPNIDDGAASLEEALAMARICVRDGMTHVVATPHCHRQWRHLREEIVPRVERLNEALAKAEIPLIILPGSEIQAYNAAQYRRDFEAKLFCHLGDRSAYTLLEFPWKREEVPADAADLVAWIVSQGTTPILAHPERHPYYADEPKRLQDIVDAGAWLQITVDSLTGNHGSSAKTASHILIRQFPAVVLSTDAHNLHRCSGLSPGFDWVREHLGADREADLRGRAQQILDAIGAEG